jgi:carboxyl-terminal processing protease
MLQCPVHVSAFAPLLASSSASASSTSTRPAFVAPKATATPENSNDSIMDQLSQACKGMAATVLIGGALFLCPPPTFNTRPAWAQDTPTAVVQSKTTTTTTTTTAPVSALLAGNTPSPPSQSVVDEVWTLVNKYYIDRTFNGQDWDQIHNQYSAMDTTNDKDKSLKLVTEMVKTLGDKYSRVLDPQQYTAIQKYDLIGIGATLMPNENKDIIVGAPPVAGSASDQAGLKVGDCIDAINGIPTKGRTAFDIIDQISENPNAKTVTMTVRTQGPNDAQGITKDLVMERRFQEIRDPVMYQVTERRKDGTVVGYIRIAEFNSLVKARLEDAIASLEKAGANAYVLDLRGNPGGAFQSAVEISSLFVENRVATYVVDSNNVQMPFRTATGRVIMRPDEPMAIWVDGGSASASEVLTGSLHDNCRAVVMGEKSFGKGLIQAVYGLKTGAGLVLTVAKYVTPNGTEIQGIGISPDVNGGVPFQPIIGLFPDTSKVDFREVATRLRPEMCKVPDQHAEMNAQN